MIDAMFVRPTATSILRIVAAALALLALAYGAWWLELARLWPVRIEHWVAARAAAGWAVSTGTLTVDGFPGMVRIHIPQPALSDPAGDSWSGPPLVARLSPLTPWRLRLSAPGGHVLGLAGRPALTLTAGTADVDLAVDRDGVAGVDLAIAAMTVGGARVGRLAASLRRLAVGAARYDQPSLAASLAVEQLELPAAPWSGAPPEVASARLDTRLLGRAPDGISKLALAAWRDGGGVVEIDAVTVDWPPMCLDGKATLALDGALQPLMAGSFHLRGLPQAIDGLQAAGIVSPAAGSAAKLVLALSAQRAADGAKEWTVPITVQDRTLSIGPVALVRLPPIDW